MNGLLAYPRFPVTYWVAARDAADRRTGSHAAAQ
jgi:hypothetical protein